MRSAKLLSVIVPCYNEAEALPRFYPAVSAALRELQVGHQLDYELILVDDGSADGTTALIHRLAEEDAHVRYVVFSRNFGKEAAMYAGLREAKGDYCVMMDADLQHPPTLLEEMYKAVSEEGWDCCGGRRVGREGDGAVRSFLSRRFYQICEKLTRLDMQDGYGDFRMMCRPVVDAILEMGEYNRYMKGIFSFVGFETKWIPYENVERACGQTKWNFKSLFRYAFEGILSFSTAPLKLAGMLSGLLFFFGFVVLLVNLLAGSGLGGPMLGVADILLLALLWLGSLQMLVIYILGAYLSKDYLENKRRPVYIVKEKGQGENEIKQGTEKKMCRNCAEV